jgi:hypothetical protein
MNKKIAVFIGCNKAYFKYAITTLLTYKRFRPEWDYFVVSEEVFDTDMMNKGVALLQHNFSDVWNNEGHRRDLHCYWHLSMLPVLKAKGYDLSATVDADTLCINDPWPNFRHYSWAVSAVKNSGAERETPAGLCIPPDKIYETHIHTAVTWYNHEYTDLDFTDDIVGYYKWLQKIMTVKHDQHLLCLFLANYTNMYPLYQLPLQYNFFFKRTDAVGHQELCGIKEPPLPASIVHFQGHGLNPWTKKGVTRGGLKGHYIKEYREFYKSIWGEECPVE